MKLTSKDFKGIFAAPVLPMIENGEIDWDTLPTYIEWLVNQGPNGLAINMDAGEGHSLSKQERRQVIEAYVKHVNGRCLIITGIIASTTQEAIELGKEAKQFGVDGIVLFPPLPLFSGTPLPEELPYSFHKEVATAVDLPMVIFQFPFGTGPDYPENLLEKLGNIEQVVAIKDASFETLKLIEVMDVMSNLQDPISVFTGADQILFEQFVMGADGALIGFASTLTAEVIEMFNAVQEGRYPEAKAIWDKIGPLARYAWRRPFRDYRPRMKEVLVAQGILKTAKVRKPLQPVSVEERKTILELAKKAGAI